MPDKAWENLKLSGLSANILNPFADGSLTLRTANSYICDPRHIPKVRKVGNVKLWYSQETVQILFHEKDLYMALRLFLDLALAPEAYQNILKTKLNDVDWPLCLNTFIAKGPHLYSLREKGEFELAQAAASLILYPVPQKPKKDPYHIIKVFYALTPEGGKLFEVVRQSIIYLKTKDKPAYYYLLKEVEYWNNFYLGLQPEHSFCCD